MSHLYDRHNWDYLVVFKSSIGTVPCSSLMVAKRLTDFDLLNDTKKLLTYAVEIAIYHASCLYFVEMCGVRRSYLKLQIFYVTNTRARGGNFLKSI